MNHPTDFTRAHVHSSGEGQHPVPASAPRFTQTLPRDDGPDWPATTARIFPSVPGHREGLDVLAYLEDDAPRFHIGPATLDADQARALIAHLTAILDTAGTHPHA